MCVRESERECVYKRGRERERESRHCQDSFALFYEDGLCMTVRYRGHHCTQLRLGVVSPVGRDGRPPTLIRVGQRTLFGLQNIQTFSRQKFSSN